MDALNAERRQQAHNAIKRLGLKADQPRGFVAQVDLLGHEADLLALPFLGGVVGTGDDPQALQDPTTGALFFMAGLSPVSGSDVVGS